MQVPKTVDITSLLKNIVEQKERKGKGEDIPMYNLETYNGEEKFKMNL